MNRASPFVSVGVPHVPVGRCDAQSIEVVGGAAEEGEEDPPESIVGRDPLVVGAIAIAQSCWRHFTRAQIALLERDVHLALR
jgi:hypothetical protein